MNAKPIKFCIALCFLVHFLHNSISAFLLYNCVEKNSKYDNEKETDSDGEISLVQKQYGSLKEQYPELSESELFDLETQQGLELLDDSTLKSTPDMVDIEYGDEFQGTFARRFGAVRSMLTELSCRSGTCVHSRKYTRG